MNFTKITSLMAIAILFGATCESSALTPNGERVHVRPVPPHKCTSKQPTINSTYNAASTALTVRFPTTSGGKVEIYRNGTKVVNANAAAGATLVYTLRNYGNGCYTIVVSSGKTVVYSNNVTVK